MGRGNEHNRLKPTCPSCDAPTPKGNIHDSGPSKANWLYNDSGKYRARAVRPPKNRPSSSRTVFHAPAGPANNTKMRTASVSFCVGGCTTCTITRSTVPFFEHSSPLVSPRSSAHIYKRRERKGRRTDVCWKVWVTRVL